MCLLSMYDQEYIEGLGRATIGYKSFKKGKIPYSGKFGEYKLDTILVPSNSNLPLYCQYADKNKQYKYPMYLAGFHIFLDKDCAEVYKDSCTSKLGLTFSDVEYIVCPVYFSEITTIGYNGDNHFLPMKTEDRGLTVIVNKLYIKSSDWNLLIGEKNDVSITSI